VGGEHSVCSPHGQCRIDVEYIYEQAIWHRVLSFTLVIEKTNTVPLSILSPLAGES
jgi:hypothetical protein